MSEPSELGPPPPLVPSASPPLRRPAPRGPLALVAVAALLGAIFAYTSTADFVLHLDRQVHPLHCSLIPGAAAVNADEGAAGCQAAMLSPHSSFFRGRMWGGVPISLFALGTFAFLLAFALTLVIAPPKQSRHPYGFLALAALVPLGASLVYFTLALTSVGQLCTVCVGIYLSTLLLAGGVAWLLAVVRKERPLREEFQPSGWWGAWLVELGLLIAIPIAAYVATLPSYAAKVAACEHLSHPQGPRRAVVKLRTKHPRREVLMVVDPLCPSCKAVHEQLERSGRLEEMDARMILFPLDSKCNWMLQSPMHPGACVMARAVMCAGNRAREVLEWSYEEQESLTDLARHDEAKLVRRVQERFSGLGACMESRETERRLEAGLQWAVDNHLPVMTPQLYIDGQRLCDEDTDLGFEYALGRLLDHPARRR